MRRVNRNVRLFCAQLGGKVQAQAVLCQSSFYACNDSSLYFGLGAFSSIDLVIDWPKGLGEQYSALRRISSSRCAKDRELSRTKAGAEPKRF
jgi:hypothetical protein